MTNKLLADLKELFFALDVDGDDRVSFEELQQIENAINLQEDLKANWARTRGASMYFDDAEKAENFADLIKGFKGDVTSRGIEMTQVVPSPTGSHYYEYRGGGTQDDPNTTMTANTDKDLSAGGDIKMDRLSKSNILFGCMQKSRNSMKNRKIGFSFG